MPPARYAAARAGSRIGDRNKVSTELFQFADFELNPAAFELRRGGAVVVLQRIPFELLCLLVERRGQLVTREEILECVWGKGVFVDIESSINTAIRKLRRALGDDPDQPRFIATIPARGYRFIADIRASRPLAPRVRSLGLMVGRERELETLLGGLDDAMAGHWRLFLVSGEPGVGKTRLASEVAMAAAAKPMTILVGHCSEHAEAVAYLPFVEILENFVAPIPIGSLRAALGAQGPELARMLPKLKNLLPDLPPPLELPPAQARRHLFNCFFEFIAQVAMERPTLMILEDLHWADDSTLSLIDHLTPRLTDLPLTILGTFRDADTNVSRELAKTLEDLLRGRRATALRLKALPRAEVATMLKGLSGKSAPAKVVGEIFDETGGNPFFVEELYRYLEEENRLFDEAGQFRTELKIAELDAPPSVRLVVARRLARLNGPTRQMLGTAAVVGRSFGFEILQAASGIGGEALLGCVEEAERAGLLIPVAESPAPRFAFFHELVRQGVLGDLSAARRQKLHLEVAMALEQTFSTTRSDYYGELAHHFRLGGDPLKAIDYLVRAAREAARRSAPQQAVTLATTGLELLGEVSDPRLRDQYELALQMTLGTSGGLAVGFAVPEVERAYTKAMELLGRADRTPTAIRAMVGLYVYYSRGADYQRASTLQAQLLGLVPTLAETQLRGAIHYSIGFRLLYHGAFEQARHQLEQAIEWSPGHPRQVQARAALALTMWDLGYPTQAASLLEQAEAEARQVGEPYTQVMVFDNACMIHSVAKDIPNARRYAQAIIEQSVTYGFAAEIGIANIILAWADGLDGDPAALDRLRRSVAEFEATEGDLGRIAFRARIAEVCLKFGRTDEAVTALAEAIEFTVQSGQAYAASEVYRLRALAEQQLRHSDFDAAVKWFERSIEAARECHARIAELRATTDLVRLLTPRRKRARAARSMLEEIYGWFTEGFDTGDLKAAKALLAELNA